MKKFIKAISFRLEYFLCVNVQNSVEIYWLSICKLPERGKSPNCVSPPPDKLHEM